MQSRITDLDMRHVQRQAFAGMLWSKQFYNYDLPAPVGVAALNSPVVGLIPLFAMPDKWEYPWFAAWDLAFHCVTLALIDPEFAGRRASSS